jgi:iron-sulfur cluster assembly accessory protein
MSLPRTTSSVSTTMFRFAAGSAPRLQCHQCLRPAFRTSQPALRFSSRRNLQTATAYRPYTLDPMPSPRNAGVPETSIAGLPPLPSTSSRQSKPSPAADQPISIPEQEAQKSSTANTSSSATTSATTKPQRKSKLRPRKAAITLSSSAVSHLRELLEQPEAKLVRVGVRNRGCSGLAYHLEYVDKAGAFDETVEQDGVKVLIDSKALFSIIGSEMDWLEDKLNERFIFKNPNISKSIHRFVVPNQNANIISS